MTRQQPMRSENRSPHPNTRRTFLKPTGAMAAGLYLTRTASAQGNTLAVNGGAKAVTASYDNATSWPRYGTEEEQAQGKGAILLFSEK